jgi:hypothetical protein
LGRHQLPMMSSIIHSWTTPSCLPSVCNHNFQSLAHKSLLEPSPESGLNIIQPQQPSRSTPENNKKIYCIIKMFKHNCHTFNLRLAHIFQKRSKQSVILQNIIKFIIYFCVYNIYSIQALNSKYLSKVLQVHSTRYKL